VGWVRTKEKNKDNTQHFGEVCGGTPNAVDAFWSEKKKKSAIADCLYGGGKIPRACGTMIPQELGGRLSSTQQGERPKGWGGGKHVKEFEKEKQNEKRDSLATSKNAKRKKRSKNKQPHVNSGWGKGGNVKSIWWNGGDKFVAKQYAKLMGHFKAKGKKGENSRKGGKGDEDWKLEKE